MCTIMKAHQIQYDTLWAAWSDDRAGGVGGASIDVSTRGSCCEVFFGHLLDPALVDLQALGCRVQGCQVGGGHEWLGENQMLKCQLL